MEKEGYEFLGWAETASATEPKFKPGESSNIAFGYSDATKAIAKTLYAVWGAEQVKLSSITIDTVMDCNWSARESYTVAIMEFTHDFKLHNPGFKNMSFDYLLAFPAGGYGVGCKLGIRVNGVNEVIAVREDSSTRQVISGTLSKNIDSINDIRIYVYSENTANGAHENRYLQAKITNLVLS